MILRHKLTIYLLNCTIFSFTQAGFVLTPGPSPKERGEATLECYLIVNFQTVPVIGSPLLWRGVGGEVRIYHIFITTKNAI